MTFESLEGTMDLHAPGWASYFQENLGDGFQEQGRRHSPFDDWRRGTDLQRDKKMLNAAEARRRTCSSELVACGQALRESEETLNDLLELRGTTQQGEESLELNEMIETAQRAVLESKAKEDALHRELDGLEKLIEDLAQPKPKC